MTPLETGAPGSLGHLCSVAAALSSDSASPAPRLASSTPDACEAAAQPHSCPSPSCPEPELHASTGEELSSASSSDLDSSSPDSCYDQAFICEAGGGGGSAVRGAGPAAPSALRLQGSSKVQRLPQPCAQHLAPPRVAARRRRPLGQAEVYRFGQGMQLRGSRLSVPGAPRGCQRMRSAAAARHAPARGPTPPACDSHSSAPNAPGVPVAEQPAAAALRLAALQVAAPAPPQPPQQQQQQSEAAHSRLPQQGQPPAGGDTTVALANLMAGHSLARLPPAQLALLIANHNGTDPVLTQALQCAMAALSDAHLGAVGCAPLHPHCAILFS